jgi:prolyl 4-hydroxylase
MLDSLLIARMLNIFIIICIILYQYTQQERINCAVHGTCPREEDYGVTQVIDAKHVTETNRLLRNMVEYFKRLRSNPKTPVWMHVLLDDCKNEDANCAFWSLVGECDKSPGYMKVSCAAVCQSCDQLSRPTRCPVDPNASRLSVWKPGSVNEFFQNMTTLKDNQKYEPVVLSRPTYINNDTEKTASYKVGSWLLYFDNFLSDKEADKLISIATSQGFQPNKEAMGSDYVGNEARTGTQTWLTEESSNDAVVKKLMTRIEKLTHIPNKNAEYIQVLRYESPQLHKLHHDYIYNQIERQPGARIFTIFLYLSNVEEGGETDFPRLKIAVKPKKGRALIFPSVLDEEPDKKDGYMYHQASVVKKGVKYAANIWIHQRDFKNPNKNNCH